MASVRGGDAQQGSSAQGAFLVQLARARKHLDEERYDVARSELELALLARPNDEDVLNLLSVIEFKRGYYHEAAQAARVLLKSNPTSSVLHSNLGLILFKAGVLGEAEDELRRAIDLQPDHVRSHLYLGLLYRMRGKLGLALEHLRFAGAKKVVAEIEETLKRSARDPGRMTGRATAPAPAPISSPPPTILRLAPSAPAAAPVTPPAAAAIPSPAEAAAPANDAGERTLSLRRRPTLSPVSPDAGPTPGADFLGEGASGAPPRDDVAPLRETAGSSESGAGTGGPMEPEREVEAEADVKSEPMVSPFPEADEAPRIPVPVISPAPPASLEVPSPAHPGADPRPLFVVLADGGLEVASRGVVFVRKGSVVWYSGKMRFAPEAAFRGTRLEKILRAEGRGFLFANDPGRQAFQRELTGESLFVEGSRVLALDNGLSFRLEPIHDFRMNRRVDILKISGPGQRHPLRGRPSSRARRLAGVSAERLVAGSRRLDGRARSLGARGPFPRRGHDAGRRQRAQDPVRGHGHGADRAAPPAPAGVGSRARGRRRPPFVLEPRKRRRRAAALLSERRSSVRARGGSLPRGKVVKPPLRGVEDPIDRRGILVLAIDPDHRLRAGKPVQDPAPPAQDVLDPVPVANLGDGFPADVPGRRVSDAGKELPDHGDGEIDVPPPVRELAELASQIGECAVQIAAGEGQALDQKQGIQHAVALRQMKGERVPSALLAARVRRAARSSGPRRT